MTRPLMALVSACLLTLLLAVPALAHAELEESDPADGATIQTPYTLTATFSEDFSSDPEQSFIRVQNAGGDVVAEGGHSDESATMTVELPALDPGEYTVRWQTTTVDDNGVERGTFTFNVEASPTPAPTPTNAPTEPPGSTPTPAPPATATPVLSPAPSASPTGSNGSSTGVGSDVLVALVVAVAAVGGLAYFLLRRSRP